MVARRLLTPHALVPLLAACAGFALSGADAPAQGTATSASPRVAIGDDARPGPERFPADGPSLRAALDTAKQHWGAAPCGDAVTIGWTTAETSVNATATWRNPSDAWNNAGENFDCRIDFNTAASFDWPKLCSVMVHEVGHLLGRQHAGDPADVMAALYSRPVPVCEQVADPAAPPPPPAAPAAPQVDPTPAADVTAKAALAERALVARVRARWRAERRRAARRAGARSARRCRGTRRKLARRGGRARCRVFRRRF